MRNVAFSIILSMVYSIIALVLLMYPIIAHAGRLPTMAESLVIKDKTITEMSNAICSILYEQGKDNIIVSFQNQEIYCSKENGSYDKVKVDIKGE